MSEPLDIKRETQGDVLYLTLIGSITEDSHIEDLPKDLKPIVIIDLKGIVRINSYGIRQWINVMKEINQGARQLIFAHCPPTLVEQFNMISNFGGGGMVYSFALPFHCEHCDRQESRLFILPEGRTPEVTPEVPSEKCSDCSKSLSFNDIEDEYFYFLQHQKGRNVDPAALTLLRKNT